MKFTDEQISKFHGKYEVKDSGCWEWTGCRQKPGPLGRYLPYGWFYPGGKEQLMAHRASWVIHNGAIGSGLEVMHKCDNPPCCNPAHLQLGTHAENMQDMAAKGRSSRSRPRTPVQCPHCGNWSKNLGAHIRVHRQDK